MSPIVTLAALSPFVAIGLSIVINLVAVGAVLVLLVSESARVAEMENLALNLTIAPKRRVGCMAVRALVIIQSRSSITRLFLVGRR